jgi:methionyl-tRNA formyltransferase
VSASATERSIPQYKPATLRDPEALDKLMQARPDVMVVAAYGLIVPREMLAMPPRGCINIHASLLPRWRGAAPIQRAILAGDDETGISIMQMDEGLDTGGVLLEHRHRILPSDTAATLTDALAMLGAVAITQALARLGALHPKPQDDGHATYAAKIAKSEAMIDWSRSDLEIERQVRAFNPAPGAMARFAGASLKIWQATPVPLQGPAGEVLRSADDLVVACGAGALALRSVQRPGGKPMSGRDFLRGNKVPVGLPLESAEGR